MNAKQEKTGADQVLKDVMANLDRLDEPHVESAVTAYLVARKWQPTAIFDNGIPFKPGFIDPDGNPHDKLPLKEALIVELKRGSLPLVLL